MMTFIAVRLDPLSPSVNQPGPLVLGPCVADIHPYTIDIDVEGLAGPTQTTAWHHSYYHIICQEQTKKGNIPTHNFTWPIL